MSSKSNHYDTRVPLLEREGLERFMCCSSGMLQMLMDTDLDITQQDYVRTAQASGKALVSLINEVLDQSKVEHGKLELEVVRFDLRAVLDDILSLFYGKAQEKGIEVIGCINKPIWQIVFMFYSLILDLLHKHDWPTVSSVCLRPGS